MNNEWSLSILYSGYDSEEYQNDISEYKKINSEIAAFAENLGDCEKCNILKVVELFEKERVLFEKLYSFSGLKGEADTNDSRNVSELGKVYQIRSTSTKARTKLQKYVAEAPSLKALINENPILKEYEYMLNNMVEDNKYMLSDEVEEALVKYDMSGADAWSTLQAYLTSSVKADYEGKQITLSEVRNLAYEKDADVRKKAYEAEIKAYEKIKDSVAFSINSIKKQTISECELRGFKSPLEKTLYESRMSEKTLNALLDAMKEFMPNFRNYLKIKAKALGYEGSLPWWDMFAPMGESTKQYTIEEAREYLLNIFDSFNPEMSKIINKAYDNEWIDFFPREGKVGGAFCASITPLKEFRVLTNFDGSFSSVNTLAHELGHGYHDFMVHDNRPLNVDYSMPVAETASTFNENVVKSVALANTDDVNEKLALLENELMDVTQIIVDIYSRFLFEKEVFDRRNDEFMNADDLCDIMLRAQKEAYGDGIAEETLNRYMWICKSHYYSAGLAFYNFPYAFGGLFARGLYIMATKDKDNFLVKYNEMLKKTPVLSVEDAAKICGVDVSDKEFWLMSLNSYIDTINEYKKILEK